jgi:hypothetical protein
VVLPFVRTVEGHLGHLDQLLAEILVGQPIPPLQDHALILAGPPTRFLADAFRSGDRILTGFGDVVFDLGDRRRIGGRFDDGWFHHSDRDARRRHGRRCDRIGMVGDHRDGWFNLPHARSACGDGEGRQADEAEHADEHGRRSKSDQRQPRCASGRQFGDRGGDDGAKYGGQRPSADGAAQLPVGVRDVECEVSAAIGAEKQFGHRGPRGRECRERTRGLGWGI